MSCSFDDMMDLPLDSSPLKAPSPRASTTPSSRPESPSPLGPIAPRLKRPAEDLIQFAAEVSRAHKLAKSAHDDLNRFSKFGRGEQMVYIAGQLLALGQQQKLIQPAAKDWTVPKSLATKIDTKAAILMADSSIPTYRDDKIGPSKLLMDLVLANPGWGFASELKDEQPATDAVSSAISRTLISKRNIVKTAILGSLGSDPEDGATLRPGAVNIVDHVASILVKLKVKSIKPNLPMCGRIAILRKLISEKNDNKYWGDVDSKLANVRAKHTDAASQSKFIKQWMLDPDLKTYGSVDLNALALVAVAVAAPVAGPSAESAADDDDDD
ncbi:hypothetical protein B0H13DRAFT_2331954 [Mycena leptocephala]|nr:hypothetical protein B0H13DRAFT_2331954 [Mycena leptocephala]